MQQSASRPSLPPRGDHIPEATPARPQLRLGTLRLARSSAYLAEMDATHLGSILFDVTILHKMNAHDVTRAPVQEINQRHHFVSSLWTPTWICLCRTGRLSRRTVQPWGTHGTACCTSPVEPVRHFRDTLALDS
jgi:hypothetical protein